MATDAIRIQIRVAAKDCPKAWGLLVRNGAGTALPDRVFVVSPEAAQALAKAGVDFAELSREPGSPTAEGVVARARI
jgi:hypothetical protein